MPGTAKTPKTDQRPVVMLRTFMAKNSLIPSIFANALGIAKPTMYSILAGKTRITVPMALRLARYFGTTAEYWIDAQTKADLANAADDKVLQKVLNGIVPLKKGR